MAICGRCGDQALDHARKQIAVLQTRIRNLEEQWQCWQIIVMEAKTQAVSKPIVTSTYWIAKDGTEGWVRTD